jgi:class 3 adenylate cyclase
MTKEFILESKRNHKLSMTIRVLRIIRLIRIVKLYKAAVFFVTNLEKKKMMAKLVKKKLEKEKMLKKREEERRRYYEKKSERKSLASKKASKGKQSILMNLRNNHNEAVPRETGMAREIIIGTEEPLRGTSITSINAEVNNRTNALLEFQKMKEIEEKIEQNEESNISKAASESITQKVIIVILLMLFIAPLTDDDVYYSDSSVSFLILCKFINNFWAVYGDVRQSNSIYNRTLESYINNNTDPYYPIIYINYNYSQIWRNKSMDEDVVNDYRRDEKGYAFSADGFTQIVYSTKKITKLSAGINIGRTFFVICILSYFAVVLEKEVKSSVVTPLEAMIDLVDSVAQDPTSYKNIENLRHKVKNSMGKSRSSTNVVKMQRMSTTTQGMITSSGVELEGAEYEIKVIQLAIIKISALLAIGFGEAGGAILRENISSQEGLNPMIPGKKKCAIFGFCDIRGFPDINVALQEKTMVFVNEIADIVHSSVDKFSGSANKNIGDAFLIVWKFPHLEKDPDKDEVDIDPMERLKKADERLNSIIADQAVLGYLNIIKKVNKSQKILSYRYNSEIRAKFGDKFKVNMGFGLHVGWGIEGPIGSFYKIDCSYLSPNVNISARLEAASRQYGVTILLSGELYDLLSDELKSICRLIDIIAVKGSKFPIRIYTIHVNDTLKPEKQKRKEMSMKEKRKYYQMKKEKLKAEFQNNKNFSIGKFILNKKGFRELLIDKKRPVLFYDKFREGFKNYIEGKWDCAYKFFKDAYYLDPSDGPTKTLLNFIKSRNKTAPENWKGFRELTSK